MKTMRYFVMLLCSMPLLAACSNEGEQNDMVSKVPLEIQVRGNDTRAIIEGTTLPTETSFGIYGTTDDKTIMSGINNMSVFYDGKCRLEKEVLLDKTTFHVKAYYPYLEEVEHGVANIDIRDQIDFLYGSGVDVEERLQEISSENPKANIVFKHALSRITFKVKHTELITEDIKLTNVFISPIYMTATYNVLTQELISPQVGEYEFAVNVTVGKEFSSFDLLMIPGEINSDCHMGFYGEGLNKWAKLPDGVWKAGQQYTYEVTFDNNGVKISEADITPWDSTTQEGSEITDDNLVTY